ncbi:MAG: monovalent cation/H(+) antiporter subunit G [Aquisalimonadaceae bacterium]
MSNAIAAILALLGAAFVLIGALGVMRMPDLMLRMHATTKAGALGGGLLAISAGVHFGDASVMVRAIAILGFVILTAPIAAHVIARAAYFTGVEFWDKTLKDELREKLDTRGHVLYSGFETKDVGHADKPDADN